MQCRNATQLFSSSSFCIFENLTATYRTTKMAISQILDTLKGSRHGFRSAECLEFFSVWSSVQETFFGRCQPWFSIGETVCCRINPWNSWCRFFRGRRWDILFLQFRSFILFSFLLSSSRLFGSQFSRVWSWRSRPQTSLSQYLKSNKPCSKSCNRVISRVKTTWLVINSWINK